jgi:hypothetical protein
MLSNAGLAVAIENINGLPSTTAGEDEQDLRKKQNIYFAFILYSTFGLSAVRFIGVSDFSFFCLFLRPRLRVPHPVLMVLLQAQPFPVLQEVVNLLSSHMSFIHAFSHTFVDYTHGRFLISFLLQHLVGSSCAGGVHSIVPIHLGNSNINTMDAIY